VGEAKKRGTFQERKTIAIEHAAGNFKNKKQSQVTYKKALRSFVYSLCSQIALIRLKDILIKENNYGIPIIFNYR